MLVEIHMLQNHAPSNLNRDDTGSPKDCTFGDVRRSRISSQCLKRSIRKSTVFEEEMKEAGIGIRTRLLPELVKNALVKDGIPAELAVAAAKKVSGFGNKEGKEQDDLETAQIMFVSPKELDVIIKLVKDEIKGKKTAADIEKVTAKDLQAKMGKLGIQPMTPDIALFGRMITSNAFQDIEASMQVAHAISTNKIEPEFDFFTAVDDKKGKGEEMEEKGAGMMGDVEFNSACYYKYFTLDVDGFIENMALNAPDKRADAIQVLLKMLPAFLKSAIYTSPSGKQNTFAAHQLPDAVLIEIRPKKIPISYANAFIQPAKSNGKKDLVLDSIEKLAKHVNVINDKFSLESIKRLWFTARADEDLAGIAIKDVVPCKTIDELLKKLVDSVRSGLK